MSVFRDFKELAFMVVGVGSLKFVANRLESQVGFLCCSLEAKFFFLWKLWSLVLRSSADFMFYIMKGNLLYFKFNKYYI